ncbi:hypothetical protein JCM11251_007767 [Rhodosporidiobolus azoricus]
MVLTPLSSRASTPSTAPFSPPLRLSPSPSPTLPSTEGAFASSSSYGQAASDVTSPVHSRAPSPSAVRSRKPSTFHPIVGNEAGPASSSSSARASIDPDVTRPSLRKVTHDVWGAAAATVEGLTPTGSERGDEGEGYVLRRNSKGKGKARQSDGRRAVSEASEASAGKGKEAQKEREVIVHTLAKTDTIASISLQYGITPQALRASNRLWPSDPIFLRSTLLIPLDQCNLPSSSFGVERIAREENGDLTVWQRGGTGLSKQSTGGLGGAAERAGKEDVLLSPRARRLASSSAFELSTPPSGNSRPPSPPPAPTNEYLDVWSSPAPSSRTSFDGAPPEPSAFSPSVVAATSPNSHLPTTFDFFSASPTSPSLTTEELVSRPISPPGSSASASHSHSFSDSRPSSSAATSPPSNGFGSAAGGGGEEPAASPLEKRTLRIERRAASELAFFPPAAAEGSSSPTKSSATNSNHQQQRQRGPAEDESLFFGPLTNSLTSSFSALGLDRYLTLPPSFSRAAAGGGAIALPPSPGSGTSTPRREVGGGGSKSRWSILNFGAEEVEAGFDGGGEGRGTGFLGDYFSTSSSGTASRTGKKGRGLPSSTSAGSILGLTDTGTWSRSARPFNSDTSSSSSYSRSRPLPPLPVPSSPRRHPSSPQGKKLRDSNERVPTGAELGLGELRTGQSGTTGGGERLRGLFE